MVDARLLTRLLTYRFRQQTEPLRAKNAPVTVRQGEIVVTARASGVRVAHRFAEPHQDAAAVAASHAREQAHDVFFARIHEHGTEDHAQIAGNGELAGEAVAQLEAQV